MEFQVIYSRKIQGSIAAFTGIIFAFQYDLTRETVAENFSRTGIDWSEFISKETYRRISESSIISID